uniref:Uncharacterized protein n=1 Tax=Anguilla anguilla TaxID=7936 RepID=A0A0E9W4X3_ANGAN
MTLLPVEGYLRRLLRGSVCLGSLRGWTHCHR